MFLSRQIIIVLALSLPLIGSVRENTGDMHFKEDLFKVGSGTISLDVALTYLSGIKINQHASWEGLGFDLQIPSIKRIPQGSVDEKSGAFSCSNGPTYGTNKTFRKLITNS